MTALRFDRYEWFTETWRYIGLFFARSQGALSDEQYFDWGMEFFEP